MWNTANGIRTLTGAERELIVNGLHELVDAVVMARLSDESVSLGIALFDEVTWQQQLALLLKVARPLLDPKTPAPKPSAILDATVAAIYAYIGEMIECEIDVQRTSVESFDDDTGRRQDLVRALKESHPEGAWLDPECAVMEEWEVAVEVCKSWVLADEDYKLSELALDLDPEQATESREFLGIDKDYFIDIAPDPHQQSPGEIWADLLELTTGSRPDPKILD